MKLAMLIVCMLACQTSFAQTKGPTNGNDLLQWCPDALDSERPHWNAYQAAACLHFIKGVIAGWNGLAAVSSKDHQEYRTKLFSCPPDNVTNGQLVRVVQKHLLANPESLHLAGEILVVQALSSAFPCSTTK